jgi:Lysylphosphatidylglycerol synthase TM region
MSLLADALPAHLAVRWLPAAVALHLVSQAVRSRGWFNILRLSYPHARGLRWRDAIAATIAGAGVNGVVPARAGDLVKLAFVHGRIEGARYATLFATALAETAFESLCATLLLGWVLAQGLVVAPDVGHPVLTGALAVAAITAAAGGLWRVSRGGGAGLLRQFRDGLAAFSSPCRYLAHVASWQTLARVARLGSLACFLAAFGLPSISGRPADPAAVTAFTLGTSAALLVATLTIATVLIVRELGTRSPWGAVRRARVRLHAVPVAADG